MKVNNLKLLIEKIINKNKMVLTEVPCLRYNFNQKQMEKLTIRRNNKNEIFH